MMRTDFLDFGASDVVAGERVDAVGPSDLPALRAGLSDAAGAVLVAGHRLRLADIGLTAQVAAA